MKAIWTICVLTALLLLAGPVLAQGEELPGSFGPETGFSLDVDGLSKLALAFKKDKKVAEGLRPTYQDCRDLLLDQRDAIKVYIGSNHMIDVLLATMKPVPQKHGILLSRWPSPDGSGPDFNNLRGIKEQKDRFKPGLTFWFLGYRAWNSKQVQGFGQFLANRGRWIFLPNAHQIFESKKYLDDVYTVLLLALQKERYADAYSLLSSRITKQLPLAGLEAALTSLGWEQLASFKWQGEASKRILDGIFSRRTARLEFKSGRTVVAEIYVALEEGDRRIVYITFRSAFGIHAPAMFTPEPAACRRLARQWVVRFVDSFESADLGEIVANCPEDLREVVTQELWRKQFAEHMKRHKEFAFVQEGSVQMKRPAGIRREDPLDESGRLDPFKWSKRGSLSLVGWIVAADGTRRASFEFEFDCHGGKWLMFQGNVGLPEPVPEK